MQGVIPELVPDLHLQSANSVIAMAQSAGNMIGPALGGLLVAALGGDVAMALDSFCYFCFGVIMLSLPGQFSKPDKQESMFVLLKEGWSAFISRTWLWVVVLQFAILHLLLSGPLIVLGSLRFASMVHGAVGWGGLLSLQGVGAVIGSAMAARWRPRFPMRYCVGSVFGFALAPASLAIGAPYTVSGICFFLGGACSAVCGVMWYTLMQTNVPKEKLSRVSSYDYIGSFCLLPAGYMIAAPLAHSLSSPGALWLGAGVAVVSTVMVLCVKGIWNVQAEPMAPAMHETS